MLGHAFPAEVEDGALEKAGNPGGIRLVEGVAERAAGVSGRRFRQGGSTEKQGHHEEPGRETPGHGH